MYQGDRRPHSVPKDLWGYHLDAPELSLQFIPYLMEILDRSVSPKEAPNLAAVSVHPEYFRVHLPFGSTPISYSILEVCIENVIKEQPSRVIQLITDEDQYHILFLRELKSDPLDTYR